MKFIATPLKGAFVIELEPFMDHRGVFARLFCKKEFKEINHNKEFVQVNYSLTKRRGSIRGMHYQIPPSAEIKVVNCLNGAVFDVIIDIRESSPTFLEHHGEILSKDNMKAMYIPEGVAHGFQSLEDNSELLYFHTNFYNKENERALRYNDPLLNIKWPIEVSEISEKDKNHPLVDKNFKGIKI